MNHYKIDEQRFRLVAVPYVLTKISADMRLWIAVSRDCNSIPADLAKM